MPISSFNYASHIYKRIEEVPSRGKLTITHNRRKYVIPVAAAKTIARAMWGDRSGMSRYENRTIYGAVGSKPGRQALYDQHLVVRGTTKKDKQADQAWLARGDKTWGKALTETGREVARLCFEELVGLSLAFCHEEAQRLERAAKEAYAARHKRLTRQLRGLHNAEGGPLISLQRLRDEDEDAIAAQIERLVELATKAIGEGS